MDIIIEGILIKTPKDIKRFPIQLTQSNNLFIKEKLIFERNKLIRYLQELKKQGVVKSNYRPKNKKIQSHLDEICKLNRDIKKSIQKIDLIYNSNI